MTVTRVATLDGTWELHPMLVLQPVEPHEGHGFTINHDDVIRMVAMIGDEPGIENDGFKVQLATTAADDDIDLSFNVVEFPPGEPARNAVAAMRWFCDALQAAGPMPATAG